MNEPGGSCYDNVIPPAKRRRLDVVIDDDHQTNTRPTTPTPVHYPPTCPNTVASQDSSNDSRLSGRGSGEAQPTNGTQIVGTAQDASVNQSVLHSGGPEESLDCCYGMLYNIPASLKCQLSPNAKTIPVDFRSPNCLLSKLDPSSVTFDIQCPISARILCGLEGLAEINTQLDCYSKHEFPAKGHARQNGRGRENPSVAWCLNIIIFGRKHLEEKVGEYLSKHKMYLQDPVGCRRCVPYQNPHMPSPESTETIMTTSFNSPADNLEIEQLEAGPDLLANLMDNGVTLPETEPPSLIRTGLFRHQKEALTFMLRRERGWDFNEESHDIWSQRTEPGGRFRYVNNVSGHSTYDAPPAFRGGLLADDMGLGKTLSMICLIASSLPSSNFASVAPVCPSSPQYNDPKPTLLIVPPALIQAWQKQFSVHLRPNTLKCYVYHGQTRKDALSLDGFDVVITTYYTVSAIWRKCTGQPEDRTSIFGVTWHRIVLDEAHLIQNPQSDLAQACCALRSTRRWAITGTPIQNKLADFASIVKFLRVHPYSDQRIFEKEILKPWQDHRSTDAQGFLRLKTLVRAITISRTKAVIDLPPRNDEVHHLNFTPAERERYEAAKTKSRAMLEDAISSADQAYKTFNALWLLNNLRLICNHGVLGQAIWEKSTSRISQEMSTLLPSTVDSVCENSVLHGAVYCSSCGTAIEDILGGSLSSDIEYDNQTTPFEQTICERCRSQIDDHIPNRLKPYEQDSSSSAESLSPSTPGDGPTTIESMSTKIKALVADISKHHLTDKSVVFSYWTNTLDFVQLMLDDKEILYTRIDGKMSLLKRTKALRTFQHNDCVRVILVFITCGGAGLDLTTGSRAYLLEPHWNPMIEEQALCRVHRLGQTRNVTTIRYLIRDSFEEQIVDIQKRKKLLAQVTFVQGPQSGVSISMGTLQYLKSVLE